MLLIYSEKALFATYKDTYKTASSLPTTSTTQQAYLVARQALSGIATPYISNRQGTRPYS